MSSSRVIVIHNENWVGSTTSLEIKIELPNGENMKATFQRNVMFQWRDAIRSYMGRNFAEEGEDLYLEPETTLKLMRDCKAYGDFKGSDEDRWTTGLSQMIEVVKLAK